VWLRNILHLFSSAAVLRYSILTAHHISVAAIGDGSCMACKSNGSYGLMLMVDGSPIL